jgi:hypothetical protein
VEQRGVVLPGAAASAQMVYDWAARLVPARSGSGMSTIKQIGDLVKRRKTVLDECIAKLRAADGMAPGAARDAAVQQAGTSLSQVGTMTKQIDDLYVAQIAELERLRAEAARQGAEASTAAQGAIVRLMGTAPGTPSEGA